MKWSDYLPLSRAELADRISRAVKAAVQAELEHQLFPYLHEVDQYLTGLEARVVLLEQQAKAKGEES